MKYSKGFERDFNWLLSIRHKFTFSGSPLKITPLFDIKGVSGKEAYHIYESTGKNAPTKHPLLFRTILQAKASASFHAKELYGKDRASGNLSAFELDEIHKELKSPEWFIEAVKNQMIKFYPQTDPIRWQIS